MLGFLNFSRSMIFKIVFTSSLDSGFKDSFGKMSSELLMVFGYVAKNVLEGVRNEVTPLFVRLFYVNRSGL